MNFLLFHILSVFASYDAGDSFVTVRSFDNASPLVSSIMQLLSNSNLVLDATFMQDGEFANVLDMHSNERGGPIDLLNISTDLLANHIDTTSPADILAFVLPAKIHSDLFSLKYTASSMCLICQKKDRIIQKQAFVGPIHVVGTVKEHVKAYFDDLLVAKYEDRSNCPHCKQENVPQGTDFAVKEFPKLVMVEAESPMHAPGDFLLGDSEYELIGIVHKNGHEFFSEVRHPGALVWFRVDGSEVKRLESGPSEYAPYLFLYEVQSFEDGTDSDDSNATVVSGTKHQGEPLAAASSKRARQIHQSEFGLRGIANLGNTCYLNAVIQLLLHSKILRSASLEIAPFPVGTGNEMTEQEYQRRLVNVFGNLSRQQWTAPNIDRLDSRELLQLLIARGVVGPSRQEDAHEVLRSLIGDMSDAVDLGRRYFGVNIDRTAVCPHCTIETSNPDYMEELIMRFPQTQPVQPDTLTIRIPKAVVRRALFNSLTDADSGLSGGRQTPYSLAHFDSTLSGRQAPFSIPDGPFSPLKLSDPMSPQGLWDDLERLEAAGTQWDEADLYGDTRFANSDAEEMASALGIDTFADFAADLDRIQKQKRNAGDVSEEEELARAISLSLQEVPPAAPVQTVSAADELARAISLSLEAEPVSDETIPLQALLTNYLVDETIPGKECSLCNLRGDTVIRSRLGRLSPLLMVVLSRFELERKISTKVEIPMVFLERKLIGIVHHTGATMAGGHYTTDFKHPDTGLWYSADDGVVSLLSQGPRTSGSTPYILLYEVDNA